MAKNFQLVDLTWELGGKHLKTTLQSLIFLSIFLPLTVTAASSCEEQVGQTYVRIKMKLTTGLSLETTVMELSLKQFYDLLHELEKAQNNMK